MKTSTEFYETQIGIEFEFLRKPSYSRSKIKQDLIKLLGVDIKLENGSHTDFKPTQYCFKMEDDFSGGKKLVELITGPLDYPIAKRTITLVLGYIRDNKNLFTSDKCGIHLNINYPNHPYIQRIDILKYILLFDEEQVYSRFPDRRDNIYTKSIKNIEPIHTNFDFRNINASVSNFKYPSTKYYGINFLKLAKGYLEFRYIGGKNYEKEYLKILELLDYFLFSLKNSYETPYNSETKKELERILDRKRFLFEAGKSYYNFKDIFKNINILVDGNDNKEIVKSHFSKIFGIFLPIFSKMIDIKYTKSGTINFDTDKSILEFADFSFKKTVIENDGKLIFGNCKFHQCVIKYSNLIDCRTENCDLIDCDIDSSTLKNTRIKNGYVVYSDIIGGYIFGKDFKIEESNMKGDLIFREGTYSSECEIEDSVELIDAKKVGDDD